MIWKIGVYIYTLRGSCWAAIYGVAQSRTQLKQLSSSSIYLPANTEDARDAGLTPVSGMATHSSILAWKIPWTEPGA